jgi:hypothetical protein
MAASSQRGVLLLFLSEPQPPTGKRLPYTVRRRLCVRARCGGGNDQLGLGIARLAREDRAKRRKSFLPPVSGAVHSAPRTCAGKREIMGRARERREEAAVAFFLDNGDLADDGAGAAGRGAPAEVRLGPR